MDEVLHVQACATHEMFVCSATLWGIKGLLQIQGTIVEFMANNGPSFEGKHWEKR